MQELYPESDLLAEVKRFIYRFKLFLDDETGPILSPNMTSWQINSPNITKNSPFSTNISSEMVEYDPLHRLGQKGSKVRTAGNSPVNSPSKYSSIKLIFRG